VEAIGGLAPEVDTAIAAALDKCLTHTDIKRGVRRQASALPPACDPHHVVWMRAGADEQALGVRRLEQHVPARPCG
jgi:hypothetical protein